MTNHVDAQYKALIEHIDAEGVNKVDRTGVGTHSVFGAQMRFDISDGKLPLLTTKRVFTRLITHELLWMLSGDTSIKYLLDNNVHIWDSWVDPDTAVYRDLTEEEIKTAIEIERNVTTVVFDHNVSTEELDRLSNDGSVLVLCGLDLSTQPWEDAYRKVFDKEPVALVSGDCPKVYGKQWRRWEDTRIVPMDEWDEQSVELKNAGFKCMDEFFHIPDEENKAIIYREIDQIANIIDLLRNDPDSRRIILNTWNVGEVDEMALPPCHAFVQFWTRELSVAERQRLAIKKGFLIGDDPQGGVENAILVLDTLNVPRRALSCQLYQR